MLGPLCGMVWALSEAHAQTLRSDTIEHGQIMLRRRNSFRLCLFHFFPERLYFHDKGK